MSRDGPSPSPPSEALELRSVHGGRGEEGAVDRLQLPPWWVSHSRSFISSLFPLGPPPHPEGGDLSLNRTPSRAPTAQDGTHALPVGGTQTLLGADSGSAHDPRRDTNRCLSTASGACSAWPSDCTCSGHQHHPPITTVRTAFRVSAKGQRLALGVASSCRLPQEACLAPPPNPAVERVGLKDRGTH